MVEIMNKDKEIQFIKDCCKLAENYLYLDKQSILRTPSGDNYYLDDMLRETRLSIDKKIRYQKEVIPLLLTKAIEGVNKIEKPPVIDVMHSVIIIDYLDHSLNRTIYYYNNEWMKDVLLIDEAKRKALEYVFERMEK